MKSSKDFARHLRNRKRKETIFRAVGVAATFFSIIMLILLLIHITLQGIGWLNWHFLTSFPSRFPSRAGLKSALWGSVWLMAYVILIAVPLGIASALYLEEYKVKGRRGRFIELNITNLTGVPSIIYGMLGLTVFVRFMGMGRSVLAGALTMSLLIMPVIIVASREAIRAVPQSIRSAAYALGATQWQTIFYHVLPASISGILTGVILSISRAIGETAPLIMIGALSYVAFVPGGPMDEFTALPIQIFNWAARPQADFQNLAGAGIIVLLILLLIMNSLAILIRAKAQKKYKW